MSYQVLARKWRPQNFKQMVGQQHVLRALINALEEQRLHHAYLFTGTRGVGKTTIARILVKCLNCETGITATPCGKCTSCQEIAEGRFVDLLEVDAASRTKVEDTRELLDNVHYAPTRGRFKVYLIDEVHMLSGHSFNALLKTLEEPPEHVKFLFATTDPQKLPATILSRCLQFNLKRMPLDLIQGHLQYLLQEESITFEAAALKPLARAADGSMRDALSLMDQAIAFGAGTLKADDVSAMLGTISQDWLFTLLNAIADGEGKCLLDTVEEMAGQVADFEAAADSLISLLHQVALLQVVPDHLFDEEKIQQLASRLAMEDVQLYYQIALKGRKDLPLSPDPRSGFEMLLLRMMVFRPMEAASIDSHHKTESSSTVKKQHQQYDKIVDEVADKTMHKIKNALEEKQEYDAKTGVEENDTTSVTSVDDFENAFPPFELDTQPLEAKLEVKSKEEHYVLQEQSSLTMAKTLNTDESRASVNESENTLKANNDWDWHQIVPQLLLEGMTGQFAKHCLLDKIEGNTVFLLLDKEVEQLYNERVEQELKASLEVFFRKTITISLKIAKMKGETPAHKAERQLETDQMNIEQMIADDPFVQSLQTKLGAQVLPGSIKHRKG
ncbi:MAG TPA: DNA polymerase III subunit gamma/tau [Thiothrix sp.]|nr:DNA polymerase III subunit gamma/tau [Thiothrix sp.]